MNQEKRNRKGNGFLRTKTKKKYDEIPTKIKEARREKNCPECNGEGYLENTYEICEYCGGSGKITF